MNLRILIALFVSSAFLGSAFAQDGNIDTASKAGESTIVPTQKSNASEAPSLIGSHYSYRYAKANHRQVLFSGGTQLGSRKSAYSVRGNSETRNVTENIYVLNVEYGVLPNLSVELSTDYGNNSSAVSRNNRNYNYEFSGLSDPQLGFRLRPLSDSPFFIAGAASFSPTKSKSASSGTVGNRFSGGNTGSLEIGTEKSLGSTWVVGGSLGYKHLGVSETEHSNGGWTQYGSSSVSSAELFSEHQFSSTFRVGLASRYLLTSKYSIEESDMRFMEYVDASQAMQFELYAPLALSSNIVLAPKATYWTSLERNAGMWSIDRLDRTAIELLLRATF